MRTTHEIIEEKVTALQEKAGEAYMELFHEKAQRAARLSNLGFPLITNVVDNELKGFNAATIERAKIYQFFGKEVLTLGEIKSICNQFKLTYNTSERFKDTIPERNVEDILSFVSECREKKWNFGRLETEGYHIPLTSKFLVIAPKSMFTEPPRPKRSLQDDPIIIKQVYKYDGGSPATGFDPERRSQGTDWYVVITAWGLEELILKTGSGSN